MSPWQVRDVPFKFQLSDCTLFQVNEGGLRYFDFIEGQSDHKRLFATHQRQCANVFLVRPTVRNAAIVRGHALMERFSAWAGQVLDRYGVKAKVRRLIRHG